MCRCCRWSARPSRSTPTARCGCWRASAAGRSATSGPRARPPGSGCRRRSHWAQRAARWRQLRHAATTAPETLALIGSAAMAIAEEIVGTHYRYPDYFAVDREKIREFARAVKDDHPAHFSEDAAAELGYPALVASLTFLTVAGRKVQLEIFDKFDVPINMERVLHRDQK